MNEENKDKAYMEEALGLAKEAYSDGEVPVGAVVVWEDGRIVGKGRNRREKGKCALCHAEMEAIEQACKTLGGWRLHKATLYVTMEPCPMCAGAIFNARIPKVVYGASDPKAGAYGSVFDLNSLPLNHKTAVEKGLLREESAALLSAFFKDLRKRESLASPPVFILFAGPRPATRHPLLKKGSIRKLFCGKTTYFQCKGEESGMPEP